MRGRRSRWPASCGAPEVDALTSFFYLYQEQVSFLMASDMEFWRPELRHTVEASFELGSDVLAFDYSTPARKDALDTG